MHLKPEALSPDGYIIDQRQTDNINFGHTSSENNGCGWIACYNFLKALGRTPDPEALLYQLERTLLGNGALGLHLFALIHPLKKQKLPLHYAIRPFHAQLLSETAQAGIVLYCTGARNHYVAFRRESNGTLQFYGAVPGKALQCPMAEFYWEHTKHSLALTITTDENK